MDSGGGTLFATSLVVLSLMLPGCGTGGGSGAIPLGAPAATLLFKGAGTSPSDVLAVEVVLHDSDISYSTANSAELNAMNGPQIRRYRLLIVPGGNFVKIGKGLTSNTTAKVRNAVRSGTSYLGICAGAFFAGNSPYNGLNLTSGVQFGFYAAGRQGIRKAPVAIAAAGAATLDQYWEDGPQLTGWGDVVGKYPDGTPAVAEGAFGNGWVVLTGVHPEAPESWRRGMAFKTPIAEDHAYAASLISAALNRTSLPHY